jgi:mRNA-degrading endonuclease RelE of RelBE toxin-antitoxin system
MSDECQQHLRSQVKHVLVNKWSCTEYIPVAPHYLIDNYVLIYYVQYDISFLQIFIIVDQEAKVALDDPISNCSIPYTDLKPFIVNYILKRWQDSWDQQIHNKLQEIHYSLVGKTPCSYGQNPKEQVDLTRCRIGHSRLRHSYH